MGDLVRVEGRGIMSRSRAEALGLVKKGEQGVKVVVSLVDQATAKVSEAERRIAAKAAKALAKAQDKVLAADERKIDNGDKPVSEPKIKALRPGNVDHEGNAITDPAELDAIAEATEAGVPTGEAVAEVEVGDEPS